MTLNDYKCLGTKEYAIIELPEALPLSPKLQPICVARDSVYDKSSMETYKVFYEYQFRDWDMFFEPHQLRVNPNG